MQILYEDRSVIAIDKLAGWMLVPFSWQHTQRNLQAAIESCLGARAFWAKCRNLNFLRHVHRLDGDTSGILLLAKSPGAVETFGDLFESRQMDKTYLAVVNGSPKEDEWVCRDPLEKDPSQIGRMRVDPVNGKPAETFFRVLHRAHKQALVEARPFSGRTHQIRVHLWQAQCAVAGDDLYGPQAQMIRPQGRGLNNPYPLGLRAIELKYIDPFQRKPVVIQAPVDEFLQAFKFPRLAVKSIPLPYKPAAPEQKTPPAGTGPKPGPPSPGAAPENSGGAHRSKPR
jgi:23S rRNA pseudouridine1911/1915/1917 synthase